MKRCHLNLKRAVTLLAVGCAVFCLLPPNHAKADSGRLNLHFDVGFGLPISGPTRPGGASRLVDSDRAWGGMAFLGIDWQFKQPFALELLAGIGGFARRIPGNFDEGTSLGMFSGGIRWRIIDENDGYNNEPSGTLPGNLWVSAHIGGYKYDGRQPGVDVGVGYELSVLRPLSIGVFARGIFMFFGNNPEVDSVFVAGVNLSVELLRYAGPIDTDGDGVSDAKEAELGTDPNKTDSDGDGISDGIEVKFKTDPLQSDTDGDGLNDGREDANQNGILDDNETDPRRSDTDGGGIPDGDEVRDPSQDPRYEGDDDGDADGVANTVDQCPDTEKGTKVGDTGCMEITGTFTMEGVNFRSGSAELLDGSERTLQKALNALKGQRGLRVEVAGHTDNRGRESNNRKLSKRRAQAVKDWLVGQGIDRARIETKGYGSSEPKADNETEDGRMQNRRIELRPLAY